MSKNPNKILYVVSGYMRTGTSMIMKALEAGGMNAKYKQSREIMRKRFADEHYDPNIGGLYELDQRDYRKQDFPNGYEGKLIKILNYGIPTMKPMPNGIRVVFMRRNKEEIRQSYLAFFNRDLSVQNIERNMEDIIERIRNRKDVLSLDIFWYRKVVKEPRKYFEKLKKSGWLIDVDKAVGVVQSQYCRYKKEELTEGII